MFRTSFYTVLSIATLVVVAGCQKAPVTELETARAALMHADSAEADVYVADLYVAALDSFNAAQSEIEIEDGKSGFGRDYSRATQLLAFTEQTAIQAADEVELAKDEMRAEADSLIALAQSALSALPAGTTNTVTDSGLRTVSTLVNDAVSARDAGDYKTARDLAQAAVDELANSAPEETIVPLS